MESPPIVSGRQRYPKLFEKEHEAYEIQRQKEEMALYQAKFNDFVLRHNRKFGGDDQA